MAGPTMNAPPVSGGQGGDIAAQLMQLVQPILSSPKGQAMAQALMAQMGGGGGGQDPRAPMAGQMPNEGGGPMVRGGGMSGADPMGMAGPATDGDLTEMMDAQDQMRPDMPPARRDGYTGEDVGAPMPDPRQTPPGGGGGGQGLNPDGPSPQEIQMLKSSPTERNVRNFIKLFGEQAAMEAMGQGGGGAAPPAGGATYEDDVKAAMDDGDGDE